MRRALAVLITAAAAMLAGPIAFPAGAVAQPAPPATPVPDVVARAYALVDAGTGTVLAARGLHEPRLVASTVKIVTALTALRLLDDDAVITVSSRAAAKPAMRIGMNAGERWPLRDALASMMLVSANDAAYAIAEAAAGSVEAFAEAMAETGRRLGFADSTFADPAGFDDRVNAEIGPSMMSVYDLAIAGRAALADPLLRELVGTVRYRFTGPSGTSHSLLNHSRMLRDSSPRHYPGTDGIKTGYTKQAGGTFVASATRNGRTLIAVVLGNVDIYTPASSLLEWGFSQPAGSPGIGVTLPPVPAALPVGITGGGAAAVAGAPSMTSAPGPGAERAGPAPAAAVDDAGGQRWWPPSILDLVLLGALGLGTLALWRAQRRRPADHPALRRLVALDQR